LKQEIRGLSYWRKAWGFRHKRVIHFCITIIEKSLATDVSPPVILVEKHQKRFLCEKKCSKISRIRTDRPRPSVTCLLMVIPHCFSEEHETTYRDRVQRRILPNTIIKVRIRFPTCTVTYTGHCEAAWKNEVRMVQKTCLTFSAISAVQCWWNSRLHDVFKQVKCYSWLHTHLQSWSGHTEVFQRCLRSVQPRAQRCWKGTSKQFTRDAAIDLPPVQHSLRK